MTIAQRLEAGLQTDRLILCPAAPEDARDFLSYSIDNRAHLTPWEPFRTEEYYTFAAMERKLEGMARQMSAGNALHLLVRRPNSAAILGECNFSNFIRGPFQACHLGFSICAGSQGKGLMYEALSRSIDLVFCNYGLHRIMANYMPENLRSARLLMHLGFEIEGVARAYLKINGKWADHVLTSRIN